MAFLPSGNAAPDRTNKMRGHSVDVKHVSQCPTLQASPLLVGKGSGLHAKASALERWPCDREVVSLPGGYNRSMSLIQSVPIRGSLYEGFYCHSGTFGLHPHFMDESVHILDREVS